MKNEKQEVNATRLDMKLMAMRKGQGLEQMAKVRVGQLESNVRKSMKKMAPPAGFPGVGKKKGK